MRHSEKSENITQGRRSLVIASQAVGVVAVYRRRFNNFRIGNYCPDLEFHFRTLERYFGHQSSGILKSRKHCH